MCRINKGGQPHPNQKPPTARDVSRKLSKQPTYEKTGTQKLTGENFTEALAEGVKAGE